MSDLSTENTLKHLFRHQNLGVLATQQREIPYTSLVAFACSEDMQHLVFSTPKATRKFSNILSNSNASIFIDNRSNKAIDFRKAVGATIVGSVRQIRKNKKSQLMTLYLKKHPHLESFLASPSCAFLCIDVKTIYLVQRFQNVTEIHIR